MNNDDPIPGINEDKQPERFLNRRVHMANERTFLAWIRTSIGIMAFGFVVEKFALFTRQMAVILGKSTMGNAQFPSHGYSAILGIFLVGLGTVMAALSFVRYKKVQKQIDTDTWKTSSTLDALLTLAVFTIGILLVIYLIYNH